MKRLITVLLLISAVSLAQDRPATVQANTVYVSAQGKVDVAPDTAVLQFNLSAQEKTAKGAYDHATKGVEQIREMLRAASIDPSSAEFGFFRLRPIYDYRGSKRKIVSYMVNSNVVLKLKEFAKAGAVLDQISNLDVAEDIAFNYTIENTEAAKKRAVVAAIAKAKGEAEQAARGGGRTLGELIYASIDTQERVLPLPATTMESQNARKEVVVHRITEEFAPGNITLTATVYALFGLK